MILSLDTVFGKGSSKCAAKLLPITVRLGKYMVEGKRLSKYIIKKIMFLI